MKKIHYTTSAGVPPRSMEEEFLCHKKGSEWWYCTGILNDESGRLFSFQFTLARIRIYRMQMHILMTALTDFETQEHYYAQRPIFFGRGVTLTSEKITYDGVAMMEFSAEELGLDIREGEYVLSLALEVIKPPVWHCDNGVLKMGVDDPRETTYYFSYTNLCASGKLIMGNKGYEVEGQAWFDKQGGTYSLTSRWTNWEWFSMRFFDGEEIMLFSFPQDDYRDGTHIERSGRYHRLNKYSITPLDFTAAGGNEYSFGWKVRMNGVKAEEYTILPKINGQLNLFYYELVADVINVSGEKVGYCVVELLPGVYNEIKVRSVLAHVNT